MPPNPSVPTAGTGPNTVPVLCGCDTPQPSPLLLLLPRDVLPLPRRSAAPSPPPPQPVPGPPQRLVGVTAVPRGHVPLAPLGAPPASREAAADAHAVPTHPSRSRGAFQSPPTSPCRCSPVLGREIGMQAHAQAAGKARALGSPSHMPGICPLPSPAAAAGWQHSPAQPAHSELPAWNLLQHLANQHTEHRTQV